MIISHHETRSHRRSNRGFTLVELIVVMSIMSIIAVMLMFALSAARENAREAKTRAMVTKISELILDRWARYETRRVSLREGADESGDKREAALRRLKGLRDLMRMEFPQSWKDVTTEPISGVERSAASASYKRRYERIRRTSKNKADIKTYQNAECLYMILTTAMGEHSSAREHFQDSEIGDADGDELPEFIDAWGKPILFLRWAPGFDSVRQREARDNPTKNPDPWDPSDADTRTTYALYPLVLSSGIDGEYDILRKLSGVTVNDPYSGEYSKIGEPKDQDHFGSGGQPNGRLNHYDNIHNH